MPDLKEREHLIIETLRKSVDTREVKLFLELLHLRREKYRGQLESANDEEVRGRALECRDLVKKLAEKYE